MSASPSRTFASTAARASMRRILLAAAIVLACLGAWGLPASGLTTYVRDEPRDAPYLTGYLVAEGDSLKVSWKWDHPTSSFGGPNSDPADVRAHYAADVQLRSATGRSTFLPPTDVLPVEPLDRELFVNTSRLIRLDLYLWNEGQPCGANPKFDVRLMLNDKLMAAGIPGRSDSFKNAATGVPEGYCFVRIRMQSEIAHLPEGAELTLQLGHWTQDRAFRYTLKGAHRSVLEIPYYPLEELVFREPGRFVGTDDAPAPESSGAAAFPLAAGAALFVPRKASARKALPMVLLLSVGALAGCMGKSEGMAAPGSPIRGGTISAEFIPNPVEPAPADKGKGTLAGLVVDDLGLPVGRARVTLFGTDLFADTTPWGRFTIGRVPAGTQEIAVSGPAAASGSSEFKPYRGPIDVRAGGVTKLVVTLEPAHARPADARPHRHDAWGPASTLTLFSGDVAFTSDYTQTQCSYADKVQKPCAGLVEVEGRLSLARENAQGTPNIVPPGTAEIEILMTWDADSSLSKVGILVRPPFDLGAQNWVYMAARGRGEPTVLPANLEMADPGHQRVSRWAFGIYIGHEDSYALRNVNLAQNPFPAIHVEIKVKKGYVPLEPPHRDVWGTSNTYRVFETVDEEPQHPTHHTMGFTYMNIHTPIKPVPIETEWIEATLVQSRPFHNPDHNWTLHFKGAQTHRKPDNTCPGTPTEGFTRVAQATLDEAKKAWTWRTKIDPLDPDSPYAASSLWCYLTDTPAWNDASEKPYVIFNLTVTAHRDPWPGGAA